VRFLLLVGDLVVTVILSSARTPQIQKVFERCPHPPFGGERGLHRTPLLADQDLDINDIKTLIIPQEDWHTRNQTRTLDPVKIQCLPWESRAVKRSLGSGRPLSLNGTVLNFFRCERLFAHALWLACIPWES